MKAVGAGHSFSAIAMTDGFLVDVSALSGLLFHDAKRMRVTLGAGTRLRDLPGILRPLGLALENMGDIDTQTIAGATSTGTHGTGIGFGGLSTQITAVTLVDGHGEVIRVSEDERPELLPAVRLGLGALGILVSVELQCVPAYLLRAVEYSAHVDSVDEMIHRAREVDHVEAFWWPHTDVLSMKENTRLPWDARHVAPGRLRTWFNEELVGTAGHRAVCGLAALVPWATPGINRLAAAVFGGGTYVGDSHAVFTSPRRVRFREMEYAVPAEALPDVLREIRRVIESRRLRISFPVELRYAAADENLLSTAYRRESAYVAVHRYWREDPHEYFDAVEPVLRAFDGRPHWGKMHTLCAERLSTSYERMPEFLAIRSRLDPAGVFQNSYTRRVLGP